MTPEDPPTAADAANGASNRVAASLSAALVAAAVLAGLDAVWAAETADRAANAGRLFATAVGLWGPVALGGGVVVGLVVWWLQPSRPLHLSSLRSSLEAGDEPARRRRAATAGLAPIAALAAMTASAHIAMRVLAAELPTRASGAAIALATLVCAALAWCLAVGLGRRLAGAFPWPRPPATLGIGLAVAACGLLFGVLTGTANGDGGALAIFGVLKRDELDLRAPALLLVMVLAAALPPARLVSIAKPVAAVLAAGVIALTVYAGRAGMADRDVLLTVERGGTVSRLALGGLRKATDSDGDGASPYFGGGDCNDDDPAVFPAADDIPGNGIDEDCSGSDAQPIDLEPEEPEPEPKSAAEWIEERLPDDLNVVLITIDTLRYDLGYTGYERDISPNIDALAKRGVIIDKAYALASYTGKSLGPMLIGKYTSETHRGWWHFNKFSEEDTFLQERLQEAGIRTVSVQGHWYFTEKYGIGRGFDVEDHSATPRVQHVEGDTTINADDVSDAAIEQLDELEDYDGRFYLWAHYLDPHAMYMRHRGIDFGNGARELYDGEVAFTDKHVGRVLDKIAKSDFADRTAIIITSDHGEAFGEHGMWRHGFEVWEALVRVPWVIYVPGVEPKSLTVRRSAIDLVPTVLDLFDVDEPSGEGTDFISGKSMLHDLYMPPGHEPKERIVFIDMSAGPYNEERQAFIENDMKLIVAAGRPVGLYDLAKDPHEEHDLLDEHPQANEIIARYKAFRRNLRTVEVEPVER